MLEQIGGPRQQIDRDQTIRQTADQLVAAGADRGQLTKIVIQAQRRDRLQPIRFAAEKQLGEDLVHLARQLRAAFLRVVGDRLAHDGKAVLEVADFDVEPSETGQNIELDRVAAPREP